MHKNNTAALELFTSNFKSHQKYKHKSLAILGPNRALAYECFLKDLLGDTNCISVMASSL